MTEPERANPATARTDPASAEGVRPFTDYGQFGVDMIDTRVLWQEKVWVDRLGVPHAIQEMSRDYLANVIGYLHARAPEWHLDALTDATTDLTDAMERHDRERIRRAAERLRSLLALDPVRWVDATPLMHALRHNLDQARGQRF